MEISPPQVIARRANGILFLLPPLILFLGFGFIYSILVLTEVIEPDKDLLSAIYASTVYRRHRYRHYRRDYRYDYFNRVWDHKFSGDTQSEEMMNSFFFIELDAFDYILWRCIVIYGVCFFGILVYYLDRLLIPRVIMEYDNRGVYIYRRCRPVTILKYEELWSTFSEEDLKSITVHRGWLRHFYRFTRISDPTWGLGKTGKLRIETPDTFITLRGVKNVWEVEHELKKLIRKNRQDFVEELERNIQRKRDMKGLANYNPDSEHTPLD